MNRFRRYLRENPSLSLAWWVIAMGLGGMSFGAYETVQSARFMSDSEPAMGRVTHNKRIDDRDSDGSTSTTWQPTLTFDDPQGKHHSFTTQLSSSSWNFSIDARVPIRYRTDNPRSAKIDSLFGIWGGAMLGIGIGGVMSSIGFAMRYHFKRTGHLGIAFYKQSKINK